MSQLLNYYLKAVGKYMEFLEFFDEFHVIDEEELCVQVGSGKFSAKQVIEHLPSLKDLAAKQEIPEIEEKISEAGLDLLVSNAGVAFLELASSATAESYKNT